MSVSLRPDAPSTRRALNDLARHQTIWKLLNDIRMDLAICDVEGWDKCEYINLLQDMLNSFKTRKKQQ